jgi:hypothetical protein
MLLRLRVDSRMKHAPSLGTEPARGCELQDTRSVSVVTLARSKLLGLDTLDKHRQDASVAALRRLWRLVRPPSGREHVDPGDLGQYAALLRRAGSATAGRELPQVREHLAAGCTRCQRDLRELLTFLSRE